MFTHLHSSSKLERKEKKLSTWRTSANSGWLRAWTSPHVANRKGTLHYQPEHRDHAECKYGKWNVTDATSEASHNRLSSHGKTNTYADPTLNAEVQCALYAPNSSQVNICPVYEHILTQNLKFFYDQNMSKCSQDKRRVKSCCPYLLSLPSMAKLSARVTIKIQNYKELT